MEHSNLAMSSQKKPRLPEIHKKTVLRENPVPFVSWIICRKNQKPFKKVIFRDNFSEEVKRRISFKDYKRFGKTNKLDIFYFYDSELLKEKTEAVFLKPNRNFAPEKDPSSIEPDWNGHLAAPHQKGQKLNPSEMVSLLAFMVEAKEKWRNDKVLRNPDHFSMFFRRLAVYIFDSLDKKEREETLRALIDLRFSDSILKDFFNLNKDGFLVYLVLNNRKYRIEQRMVNISSDQIIFIKAIIKPDAYYCPTLNAYFIRHLLKTFTGLCVQQIRVTHKLIFNILNGEMSFLNESKYTQFNPYELLQEETMSFISRTNPREIERLIKENSESKSFPTLINSVFEHYSSKKEKVPSEAITSLVQNMILKCRGFRMSFEKLEVSFREEDICQRYEDIWLFMRISSKPKLIQKVLTSKSTDHFSISSFLSKHLYEVHSQAYSFFPVVSRIIDEVIGDSRTSFMEKIQIVNLLIAFLGACQSGATEPEEKEVILNYNGGLFQRLGSLFSQTELRNNEIPEFSKSLVEILLHLGVIQEDTEPLMSKLNQLFSSKNKKLFSSLVLVEKLCESWLNLENFQLYRGSFLGSALKNNKSRLERPSLFGEMASDVPKIPMERNLRAKELGKNILSQISPLFEAGEVFVAQGTHQIIFKCLSLFHIIEPGQFPWFHQRLIEKCGLSILQEFISYKSTMIDKEAEETLLKGILDAMLEYSGPLQYSDVSNVFQTLLNSQLSQFVENHGFLLHFIKEAVIQENTLRFKASQNIPVECSLRDVLTTASHENNALVFSRLRTNNPSIPWLDSLCQKVEKYCLGLINNFTYTDLRNFKPLEEEFTTCYPPLGELLNNLRSGYEELMNTHNKAKNVAEKFRRFNQAIRNFESQITGWESKREKVPIKDLKPTPLAVLFKKRQNEFDLVVSGNRIYQMMFDIGVNSCPEDSKDPFEEVLNKAKENFRRDYIDAPKKQSLADIFRSDTNETRTTPMAWRRDWPPEERDLDQVVRSCGFKINDLETTLNCMLVHFHLGEITRIRKFLLGAKDIFSFFGVSFSNFEKSTEWNVLISQGQRTLSQSAEDILKILNKFSQTGAFKEKGFGKGRKFVIQFSKMKEIHDFLARISFDLLNEAFEALNDKFKVSIYGGIADWVDIDVLRKIKENLGKLIGECESVSPSDSFLVFLDKMNTLTSHQEEFCIRIKNINKNKEKIMRMIENIHDFQNAVRARVSQILEEKADARLKVVKTSRKDNEFTVEVDFKSQDKVHTVSKLELDDYYANLHIFKSEDMKNNDNFKLFERIYTNSEEIIGSFYALHSLGYNTNHIIQKYGGNVSRNKEERKATKGFLLKGDEIQRMNQDLISLKEEWERQVATLREKEPQLLYYNGTEAIEIIENVERYEKEESISPESEFSFKIHKLFDLVLTEDGFWSLSGETRISQIRQGLLLSLKYSLLTENTWEGKIEVFAQWIRRNFKDQKRVSNPQLRSSNEPRKTILIKSEENQFGATLAWAILNFSNENKETPLPYQFFVVFETTKIHEITSFLENSSRNKFNAFLVVPGYQESLHTATLISSLKKYLDNRESTSYLIIIHHPELSVDNLIEPSLAKEINLEKKHLEEAQKFISAACRTWNNVELVLSAASGDGKTNHAKTRAINHLKCSQFIELTIGGHSNLSVYAERIIEAMFQGINTLGNVDTKPNIHISIGVPYNLDLEHECRTFCASTTVFGVMLLLIKGFRGPNGVFLKLPANAEISFEVLNSPARTIEKEAEICKLIPNQKLPVFEKENFKYELDQFLPTTSLFFNPEENCDVSKIRELACILDLMDQNNIGVINIPTISAAFQTPQKIKVIFDKFVFSKKALEEMDYVNFRTLHIFFTYLFSEIEDFNNCGIRDYEATKTVTKDVAIDKIGTNLRSDVVRLLYQTALKLTRPTTKCLLEKTKEITSFDQYMEDIGSAEANITEFEKLNHSIVLFSKSEFLLYFKDQKDLTPELKKAYLFQRFLLNPNADESLRKFVLEGVKNPNIEAKYFQPISEKEKELWAFLDRVCNTNFSDSPNKDFVLTSDGLYKIFLICRKLRNKVPLVLRGETGTGKTFMMRFITENLLEYALRIGAYKIESPYVVNSPFESGKLEYVLIHAGYNEEKMVSMVKEQIRVAKENEKIYKIVFLDEFNTSPCVDLISNLVTKRSFLFSTQVFQQKTVNLTGEHMTYNKEIMVNELPKNLIYIGACNPFIRKSEQKKKVESNALESLPNQRNSSRVYTVNPNTEAINFFIMDFGKVSSNQEDQYIRGMLKGKLKKMNYNESYIDAMAKVVKESHKFISKEIEERAISLRDIGKFIKCFEWFHTAYFPQLGVRARDQLDFYSFLCSIGVVYYERLPSVEMRREFEKGVIQQTFDTIFTKKSQEEMINALRNKEELRNNPRMSLSFETCFNICCKTLINKMEIDEGISKNSALVENTFCLFVCCNIPLPILLVGKPGCSKSLAMRLVGSHLIGYNKEPFFNSFPSMNINYFQGSGNTDSRAIEQVFEDTIERKKTWSGQEGSVNAVLVIDELGLAEISKHNPLKVLHGYLDDQEVTKIGFVGITNWELDAAKNSRFVLVYRPKLSTVDLEETSVEICRSYKNIMKPDSLRPLFSSLATSYSSFLEHQEKHGHMGGDGHIEFHGHRDYYNLIKSICDSPSINNPKLLPDILAMKVFRNFGGRKESARKFLNRVENQFKRQGQADIKLTEMLLDYLRCKPFRYLMLISDGDGFGYFKDLMSRNVMANNFENLLDREPLEVVGSSESTSLEEQDKKLNDDLIKIQEEMVNGGFIILRNYETLYPSLYEVFNMKRTKKGNNWYTEIANKDKLNREVKISEKFRVVVCLTFEEVRQAKTPFLNRFEKYLFQNRDNSTVSMELITKITQSFEKYYFEGLRGLFLPKERVLFGLWGSDYSKRLVESYFMSISQSEDRAKRKMARMISYDFFVHMILTHEKNESQNDPEIEKLIGIYERAFQKYQFKSLKDLISRFAELHPKRRNLAIFTDTNVSEKSLPNGKKFTPFESDFRDKSIVRDMVVICRVDESDLAAVPRLISSARAAKVRLVLFIVLRRRNSKFEHYASISQIREADGWKVLYRSGEEEGGIGLQDPAKIREFFSNKQLNLSLELFRPEKKSSLAKEIFFQNIESFPLQKKEFASLVSQGISSSPITKIIDSIFPDLLEKRENWREEFLRLRTNINSFTDNLESFIIQSKPSQKMVQIGLHLTYFGFFQASLQLKPNEQNIPEVPDLFFAIFRKSFQEVSSKSFPNKQVLKPENSHGKYSLFYPFRLPWIGNKLREIFDAFTQKITALQRSKFMEDYNKGSFDGDLVALMGEISSKLKEVSMFIDSLSLDLQKVARDLAIKDIVSLWKTKDSIIGEGEDIFNETIQGIVQNYSRIQKTKDELESCFIIMVFLSKNVKPFMDLTGAFEINLNDESAAQISIFSLNPVGVMQNILEKFSSLSDYPKEKRTALLKKSKAILNLATKENKSLSSSSLFFQTGELLLSLLKNSKENTGKIEETIQITIQVHLTNESELYVEVWEKRIIGFSRLETFQSNFTEYRLFNFIIDKKLKKARERTKDEKVKEKQKQISAKQASTIFAEITRVGKKDSHEKAILESAFISVVTNSMDNLLNPAIPASDPFDSAFKSIYNEEFSRLLRLCIHTKLAQIKAENPQEPFCQIIGNLLGGESLSKIRPILASFDPNQSRLSIQNEIGLTLLSAFIDSICEEIFENGTKRIQSWLGFIKTIQGFNKKLSPSPLELVFVKKLYSLGMKKSDIAECIKNIPGIECMENEKKTDDLDFSLIPDWPEKTSALAKVKTMGSNSSSFDSLDFSQKETFVFLLASMELYCDMEKPLFDTLNSQKAPQFIQTLFENFSNKMRDFSELRLDSSSSQKDFIENRILNINIMIAFLSVAMGTEGISKLFMENGRFNNYAMIQQKFTPGSLQLRDYRVLMILELPIQWRNYKDDYDSSTVHLFIECKDKMPDGSVCESIYPLFACNNPHFHMRCTRCNALWDGEYVRRNHRDNIFSELPKEITEAQKNFKGFTLPEICNFGEKVKGVGNMSFVSYKLLHFIQTSFAYFAWRFNGSFRVKNDDLWNFSSMESLYIRAKSLLKDIRPVLKTDNMMFMLWVWNFFFDFYSENSKLAVRDFNSYQGKKTFEEMFEKLVQKHLQVPQNEKLKEEFKKDFSFGVFLEGNEKETLFYQRMKEKYVFQCSQLENPIELLQMDKKDHIIKSFLENPLCQKTQAVRHVYALYRSLMEHSKEVSTAEAKTTKVKQWIQLGFISKEDFDVVKELWNGNCNEKDASKKHEFALGCGVVVDRVLSEETLLFEILPYTKSRYCAKVAANRMEEEEIKREKQKGWVLPALLFNFLQLQNNNLTKFKEKYNDMHVISQDYGDKDHFKGFFEIQDENFVEWDLRTFSKFVRRHHSWKCTPTGGLTFDITEEVNFDAVEKEFCSQIFYLKPFLMPHDYKEYPVFVYSDEMFAQKLDLFGTKENHQAKVTKETLQKTSGLIQEWSMMSREDLELLYGEFGTLVSWIENNYMEVDSNHPLMVIIKKIELSIQDGSNKRNPLKPIENLIKYNSFTNLPIKYLRQAFMEMEILLLKQENRDLAKRFKENIPDQSKLTNLMEKTDIEVLVFIQLELSALLMRFLMIDSDLDNALINTPLEYLVDSLHGFFEGENESKFSDFYGNGEIGGELTGKTALTLLIELSKFLSSSYWFNEDGED